MRMMGTKARSTFALSAITTAALLSACGGGGGDSTGTAAANSAPTANAGAAQTVATRSQVTLDGSASIDPNGDALSYSWTLTSKPNGSQAALSSTSAAKPTMTLDM